MSAPACHRGTWKQAASAALAFAAIAGGLGLRSYGTAPQRRTPAAEDPAVRMETPAGRSEPAPRRGGPPAPVELPASDAEREEPQVLAPDYHPRPDGEWQGMLVDVAQQQTCKRTADCGLSLACRGGRCGPCTADAECEGAEACVLDHCVPVDRVGCRTRADCGGPGQVCALSGYSADPRGNAEMQSYCLDERSGTEQVRLPEHDEDPTAGDRPPRAPSLEEQLVDML